MTDYQSTSKKNKDVAAKPLQKEPLVKIIEGDAIVKDKGIAKKFKNVFFGGDFKAAVMFVASDILLPGMRNMIADASKGAVDRVIYGADSRRPQRQEMRGRVDYRNPMRQREAPQRGYLPDQPPLGFSRSRREAQDVILATSEQADLVLEQLIDRLEKYEAVSLAELYELLGLPTQHTDHKWGWTWLSGASVRQVRDGYLLDLPPVEPI